MDLDRYNYTAGKNSLDYEFYSEGPRGAIKKVVRFSLVTVVSYTYYNLGFGDWDDDRRKIDDFVTSNNQDAERVLATVASIVIDFFRRYPEAYIYFEGSTNGRTRRYQMGISKNWSEIAPAVEVYGLIENEGFQPFTKGKTYRAFVIKRK